MTFWFQTPNFPIYPNSDHYHSQTQQFYNTPPTRPVSGKAWTAMWQMFAHRQDYRPHTRLPMQQPDWSVFLAPSSQVKFIWFGHSTVLMRVNGKTVFLDPVYSRWASPTGRFQEPPVPLDALPPIDLVVYTHAHYDHLDKAVVQYFRDHSPNTQFLTPLGVGAYLRKWGVATEKIQELDWHQSADYFGAHFHALPARHDAARTPFDGKKSLWASWALDTGQERFYFSGDSSYAPHFQAIGQKFTSFDLAFMENGQYNTMWADNHMFPDQTVQAALDVKARRWMPIHWGAYALALHGWDESVRESARITEEKHLPMLTPIMGQVFDKDAITDKWWEKVQ